MKSVVSEKGQVTIPKALRDRLGLRAGSEIDFVEENGTLVGRRIVRSDAFSALVGLLPEGGDVDALIDDLRGPKWDAAIDGAARDHGDR